MAVISCASFFSLLRFHHSASSNQISLLSRTRKPSSCAFVSMNNNGTSNYSSDELRAKFMEFPYACGPQRDLMLELLSSVDAYLGPSLQPCNLPPDVQLFGDSITGSPQASLNLRSGTPSSKIDFILGGWIHCKLPSGASLNITSLSAYLKPSTDAPHFLMELIQSSPTSFVLILDLTPRKDLILYPEYLKTYYEDTNLDRHRQSLQALTEVKPYYSPSLYIRAVVSPTAIVVSIETGNEKPSTDVEEIIRDQVSPLAKELLQFWIDSCACSERDVGESERDYLEKRDRIIKGKTIEVDLGSSFPRLFGKEVADRVLGALKEYYNV